MTEKNVTSNAEAIFWEGDKGSVEASTLGLKAGEWPDRLHIEGDVFKKISQKRSYGELTAVIYGYQDKSLSVFND